MHMLNIVKFTMGLLLTLGIQPNPVHCADPVLVVVESSQEVVLATLLRAIAKFDCIDQLSPIQLQRLENRPPLTIASQIRKASQIALDWSIQSEPAVH